MKEILKRAGYTFDTVRRIWCRPSDDLPNAPLTSGIFFELGKIIRDAADLSVLSPDIRRHCTDSITRYHLGAPRSNILRPVATKLRGRTLEVGAGCGPVTRYLGETGNPVLALEANATLAELARQRTRDLANVTILNDTLENVSLQSQFDVIVLADAAALSGLPIAGSAKEMFRKLSALLTPQGILIVGMENQLGLKYFAGATDTLVPTPNSGIETQAEASYPLPIGIPDASTILGQLGFSALEFLAPLPDHRYASSVVTSSGFKHPAFDAAALVTQAVRRDPLLPENGLFSLELAWENVVRNGLGMKLANAFVIVAQKDKPHPSEASIEYLAHHYTTDRLPQFCKSTTFVLGEDGRILVRYSRLAEAPAKAAPDAPIRFTCPEVDEYTNGHLLTRDLIAPLVRDGWVFSDLVPLVNRYADFLRSLSGNDADVGTTALPGRLFDAIPNNVICSETGGFRFIDQEWELSEPIELKYLLFRATLQLLDSVRSFGKYGTGARTLSRGDVVLGLFHELGLDITSEDIARYLTLESAVQEYVTGQPPSLTFDWRADELLPGGHTGDSIAANVAPTYTVDPALVAEREKTAGLERSLNDRDRVIRLVSESLVDLRQQRDGDHQNIAVLQQRISDLDQLVSALQHDSNLIRSSTTWRILARLHKLSARLSERQRRYLRRVAKAIWWLITPHRLQSRLLARRAHHASAAAAATSRAPTNTGSVPLFTENETLIIDTQPSSPPAINSRPKAVAPTGEEWEKLGATYRTASAPTVDILVPVYGGYDETMRCIYSVLASQNATPFNLLVVNDCSPEPSITEALTGLAARGLIELHTLEINHGFVGACNFGMALHPNRDILLLNSDTEVHSDWLDRIMLAASQDERIATITPLSNNAEICSYPRFVEDNWMPLEVDDPTLDAIASRVNAGVLIDVPTGVGFCMYVRRRCLEEIGLFDMETFGKGYGEENDLCLRAKEAGWRNVLIPNVFVRHYGAVSFAASKVERVRKGVENVERLHPGYLNSVGEFLALDPPHPYRRALDIARIHRHTRGGTILFVLHSWGGGTEAHVNDMVDILNSQGVSSLLCTSTRGSTPSAVIRHPDCPETVNIEPFVIARDLERFVVTMKKLDVRHIHIHHLADYGPQGPDFFRVAASSAGVTYDVTVHDYTAFCPRINLVDDSAVYCGEPSPSVCESCIMRNGSPFGTPSVWEWRDSYDRLFLGARKRFVPDIDVSTRMTKHFPGHEFEVRVHPELGAIPTDCPPLNHALPRRTPNRVRVAILGAIGPHKGAQLLYDTALAAIHEQIPVDFYLVGYSDRDSQLSELGVTITGRYSRGEEISILKEVDPDFIWFSSVWPETYSYTLSSAFAAGIYPVAFDMGAVSTRIRSKQWGTLLPLDLMNDPLRLAQVFTEITPTPAPMSSPDAIAASAHELYEVPFLGSYYGLPPTL